MTIRRSPLTHGQLSVWRSLAALDEAHIGAALLTRDWPIPHGATSDRVEAALGNRTSARWRSLVSTLVQLIPVLYRHDENASLADTTRQVHALAIAAYHNGSYDLDEVG